MTALIAVVIALTAFNAGRITQRAIDTEHDRITTEENA